MAATFNLGTNIARVRLLITDTDTENPIFQDEEIQEFINMFTIEGETDLFESAAQALDVIATNEVLIQKRIKILDLSTDGVAESKELRERAKDLRKYSAQQAGFEIATMNVNSQTYIDLLINSYLRNE
jgi:hypothetical protein